MRPATTLTIIILFFTSTTFSIAQDYKPMAVEGATWIQHCHDAILKKNLCICP